MELTKELGGQLVHTGKGGGKTKLDCVLMVRFDLEISLGNKYIVLYGNK